MYHQGISLKCAKVTEPGIIAHPRIPATQVVEVGESRLKASLVQKCKTLSGKKKTKTSLKAKGLEIGLKQYSACLASARP
jgi:hypothetical protein